MGIPTEPPKKKPKYQDVRPLAYVRFNPRLGKAKPITLKCSLDSGASGIILAGKYANKLRLKPNRDTKMVWTTPSGNMTTSTKKSRCTFVLPEFHRDRVIEWDINISSGSLGAHDMIIGRDILQRGNEI
jgi:hypothetical protein